MVTINLRGGESEDVDADLLLFDGDDLVLWRGEQERWRRPRTELGSIHLRTSRTVTLEGVREEHPHAYRRWDENQERELLDLHAAGLSVREIAERTGRQPGGIRSRLNRLLGAVAPT
ncbi:response regulator transcription factor [Microlunatus parietis]|uniref:DNA-directed RNA polymerase specialized sigma24 family protein n=1 Tax=Microlunatus parietis TaxID=682979 RepID=A0A7Y9LE15_9ACTN|nr:response regulator transcription factor [Microlunatus parietis]NYE74492.1 DNA-directed RNA polymerase specialized sigma24 family protein [Microlunatus parietis]